LSVARRVADIVREELQRERRPRRAVERHVDVRRRPAPRRRRNHRIILQIVRARIAVTGVVSVDAEWSSYVDPKTAIHVDRVLSHWQPGAGEYAESKTTVICDRISGAGCGPSDIRSITALAYSITAVPDGSRPCRLRPF